MRTAMVFILLTLVSLAVYLPRAHPQSMSSQEEDRLFAERAKQLEFNIRRGWTPEAVRNIMGDPDRIDSFVEGSDSVEVWGYRGYDVRIEFRNGMVSNWFFSFRTR